VKFVEASPTFFFFFLRSTRFAEKFGSQHFVCLLYTLRSPERLFAPIKLYFWLRAWN